MTSKQVYLLLAALFIMLGLGTGGFAANEKQPHMRASLQALETARLQLTKATPDKGGHRAKAIRLVSEAIAEVKAGIQADKRN